MRMSCSTPNWRGPIPVPVTSVRSPHTAPEPKLNCMSYTPAQKPLGTLWWRGPSSPRREAVSEAWSDAQDLNRKDCDSLVPEDALIGLDLPGDVSVLHHRRQPQVLNPSHR